MTDGRTFYLIAEGRLVNLAAGDGHPAEIMDLTFGLQIKCLEYLLKNEALVAGVHDVPAEIDDEVARLKLSAMGKTIDTLTNEQVNYLNSWTL